nr:MAG: putative capsid protein [Alphanecrovirus sp.]
MAKGDISYSHGRWWRDNGDGTASETSGPNTKKRPAPSKRDKIEGKPNQSRTVRAPVAAGIIITRPRVPQIATSSTNTVVTNTEQLVDLTNSPTGVFSVVSTPLIPSSMAWLAALSDLYSKYRWRRLRLVYVPSCPTTTQGSAALSLGYDRFDTNPTSIQAMQQAYKAITFPAYAGYDGVKALHSYGSVEGAVSIDFDTSRLEKTWYPCVGLASFNAFPTNVQTAYCPGTLFSGQQTASAGSVQFGTVHAQYVIEFIEPINPVQNG